MKYQDTQIYDFDTDEMKTRIIHNGTTTVVFGQVEASNHFIDCYRQILKRMDLESLSGLNTLFTGENYNKDYDLISTVEATGVAKLHPGDVYDEKTGIKLASRKAEYKARKVMRNRYIRNLNALKDLEKLLQDEIDSCGKRLGKLTEELNHISKK